MAAKPTYSQQQKDDVIARVAAGESRSSVASATGISVMTIGQWVRKASGASGTGIVTKANIMAAKRLMAAANADAECPQALKEFVTDYFNDLLEEFLK